jgi:integrase
MTEVMDNPVTKTQQQQQQQIAGLAQQGAVRRGQRLLSAVDAYLLVRAAKLGRDRLLQVAYYGALRVSELASLTWGQVIPRETGEAQLAIVGKGDKRRNVLLPAELATALAQMRGPETRVFPITERRINYIVKAAAKRAVQPATSAH